MQYEGGVGADTPPGKRPIENVKYPMCLFGRLVVVLVVVFVVVLVVVFAMIFLLRACACACVLVFHV